MNKKLMWAAAVVGLPLSLWALDIAKDRRYHLSVLQPTPLFELPPHTYPSINTDVGLVSPGDVVVVKRLRYGKDFRAWKVRTANGRDGWIKEDGKNLEVRYGRP